MSKEENKKTVVLTRKIKLAVIAPTPEKKAEVWAFLRDLRYACWKASNQFMTDLVTNNHLKERIKHIIEAEKDTEANQIIREAFGKTPQAFFRALIRAEYSNIGSDVADRIRARVTADFKNDFKEVLKGNRSIRNYKRESSPIPIRARGMKFYYNEEDENSLYLRWTKEYHFKCVLGRDRSHLSAEIGKLISGEWTFGDSQLKIIGKNLFLLLPINIPKPKTALDPDITLRVETGPVEHVRCKTNAQRVYRTFGSPDEYMKKRTQFEKRRRKLQQEQRETVGGKGIRSKIKALMTQLSKKEKDWIRTYNHRLSKRVIEFALKNNCGVIEIHPEPLPKDEEAAKFITRNWASAQLHTLIEQKAAYHDIIVTVLKKEEVH